MVFIELSIIKFSLNKSSRILHNFINKIYKLIVLSNLI